MALSARSRAALAVALVFAVLLGGLTYYVLSDRRTSGKPVVVASFYPYYFAAAKVGGERVDVVNLVPPGVEPHDWEPSPQDLVAIYDAALFVFNGYVETYLSRVLAELPADGPILVNASSDLPLRNGENGEVDPHVWLDPSLMSIAADKVADALVRADPAGTAVFRANAQALNASLTSLDSQFRAGLATCTLHTIVTTHEAFGYLSGRYNLTMVAIHGLSPDAEPTAQKIQEILELVNETGVQYIFYEELVSPAVAETLASEAGVLTQLLDPLEGIASHRMERGETYLTIMRDTNLPNLRTALGCA